jgi:hypothetical protein
MAYQRIVRTGFYRETEKSLGNVPDAYCPNFTNGEFVDDYARIKVLPFELELKKDASDCSKLVEGVKLTDINQGESMIWGGCLMTLGEDGKFYQSGFDLVGGNIPKPTHDEAIVKDCGVFGSRRNAATSVRILQEFDDGFVLSYYDVTVPFQSYKLFGVEPEVRDGLGHPKYGHSHALRFIMSNQQEHKVVLNGKMITVVCEEVMPDLYVLPHVLMLDEKYRSAFNPENVAKDYDDSVKVEVIGFSQNWSVFWAHCHIAILMKVEDDMMEPEPEPESMCSMMAGALCRGTSVASSDDGLEAPLTRQLTTA